MSNDLMLIFLIAISLFVMQAVGGGISDQKLQSCHTAGS